MITDLYEQIIGENSATELVALGQNNSLETLVSENIGTSLVPFQKNLPAVARTGYLEENKYGLKAVTNIGKNILKLITAPFYAPTFIRKHDTEYSNDGWLAYGISVIPIQIGAFVFAGKALSERGINPMENPYFIGSVGTLAATNALSSLYEWYRYEKNKLNDVSGE